MRYEQQSEHLELFFLALFHQVVSLTRSIKI